MQDTNTQTHSWRIKKCEDKTLNFFTDPDSPYSHLPNHAKYIFGEENDRTVKINKSMTKF